MPYSRLKLPIPVVGQQVMIYYPTTTSMESRSIFNYKRRSIVIQSVRDLVEAPLTPDEFIHRPYVRRGRWLASAYDCDLNQYRQFYFSSALEFAATSQLRIALYEPEAIRPAYLIYRPFDPHRADMDRLACLLHRIRDRHFDGMRLGIYCDDMRLVR